MKANNLQENKKDKSVANVSTETLYNRKNRGITLIALVVSVIVLLILAGISISMLTGQNRNSK